MGLASKSKNKDGAWEFMQVLLSEDYQDDLAEGRNGYGFPIKKSSLDKQFEKDMEPDYYEDEDGNKVESPKTTWGWDDFEMEIMAATQEEVDAVKALIDSAEKISGSVDEQNRIQTYVNENS